MRFIILFFITVNLGYSQNTFINDSIVEWSSVKKLTWNDFIGEPKENDTHHAAETTCKVEIIDSYYNNIGIPKFELKCYFIKIKSFTRVNDEVSLRHEQLHFDIWELFTRKIRKAFLELNKEGEKNVETYKKEYDELIQIGIEFNDEFDVDFLVDKTELSQWERKIIDELILLEQFKL